jgi:SAM-dependent methyltransferase
MTDFRDRPSMMQEQTLQAIALTLRDPAVVEFVSTSVKAGYREFFGAANDQVCAMVDDSFEKLAYSQKSELDPQALVAVTADLLEHTFRKTDRTFWFNQIYHQYKTELKPEADFRQLRKLLPAGRVLDYGCGSGYLAARLAKGEYQVFTADVLDYRYQEAKQLPFVQMSSPTDIPYADDSVDVALIQAVLHHIDPNDLPRVLHRLGKIARYLLIKEDTYGVSAHMNELEGMNDALSTQPLLRTFVNMPLATQHQVLVLIDFFSNAIAQGLPEMNMPFEFKTVSEWQQVLPANGFKVNRAVLAGFEPGRMHMSCHLWLLCERAP